MAADTATIMKAFVLHGAKDIRPEEVPKPVPGPGEVLVAVRAAGICGSDLHYYAHGRCGNFIPTRPFILGHEFSGEVVAHGEGVEGPAIGTRVAVDPSRACGRCKQCRQGRYNLCPKMLYYGTASVVPPRDGCYAEYVTAPARNCWPLPEGFEYAWGALLEPMSVAMHAVMRSDGVGGKSVLITGGGTIGQMILLTAAAFGASKVVVSDIKPFAREFAANHGASATLDPASPSVADDAAKLSPGGFEVVFEAAGVAPALDQAIRLAAPGATVVQVGTLPDGTAVPVNALLTKELQYVGSWRFANVFERVIEMVTSGRIDPRPLITKIMPFEKLTEAIEAAGSGNEVLKMQISRI
ncbi:MAG: NAD(P)-dependent alcohol dehydrogenase [Luteolibacter sp.]